VFSVANNEFSAAITAINIQVILLPGRNIQTAAQISLQKKRKNALKPRNHTSPAVFKSIKLHSLVSCLRNTRSAGGSGST
jgi:hypothetical protein